MTTADHGGTFSKRRGHMQIIELQIAGQQIKTTAEAMRDYKTNAPNNDAELFKILQLLLDINEQTVRAIRSVADKVKEH